MMTLLMKIIHEYVSSHGAVVVWVTLGFVYAGMVTEQIISCMSFDMPELSLWD